MEGPVESEAGVMGSDQFRLMLYVMPVLLIAWMVSCLGVNIWLVFALVICYSFWVSVVSLHPLSECQTQAFALSGRKLVKGEFLPLHSVVSGKKYVCSLTSRVFPRVACCLRAVVNYFSGYVVADK
jgi:hypothetical protein